MIPWTLLGTTNIPNNGGKLELTQREKEFSIHLKGVRGELMNSRMHCSELALANQASAALFISFQCCRIPFFIGCIF